MASLRKRPKSEYWVCCYTTADGRRTQRSTGTTDKDEAMAVCRLWENEARVEREAVENAEELAGAGAEAPRGRPMIWAATAIAILLQLGALLWFMNRSDQPAMSLLVELDDSEAPSAFMEEAFAKRHRWVKLNPELIKAFQGNNTWQFELNLFDDETHLVDVAVFRKHYTGAKSVVGLIEQDLHTSVVLSRRDHRPDAMMGSFALADGRRFLLRHIEDGKHAVVEIDPAKMPGHGQHADDLFRERDHLLRTMDPANRKNIPDVGANDHLLDAPANDFALGTDGEFPMANTMGLARMVAAAGINPSNASYGFWGNTGAALTQGPTTPARILYQRTGNTAFIDVMFVYTQSLLAGAAPAGFGGNLDNLQLAIDNLVEDTNLIFKKCLIPLELRQAVLDPNNLDPTTQQPTVAENSLFLAKARSWANGATADIDGTVQTIGVIGGADGGGPVWKEVTAPKQPIWNSTRKVNNLPEPKWDNGPTFGVYSPLYETISLNGDHRGYLEWISDPRNSLVYGDQYWPEPYINFPESYSWKLLPAAKDIDAKANPGKYASMIYSSMENPDIDTGPVDTATYAGYFGTIPYGLAASTNATLLANGEDRKYLDRVDGGSVPSVLASALGPTPSTVTNPKPNYYIREAVDDGPETYTPLTAVVDGTLNPSTDQFTATAGTFATGDATSFQVSSAADPDSVDWFTFGSRLFARNLGRNAYTLHVSSAGANGTMAGHSGFDVNSTYEIMTKTTHGLTNGQEIEVNATNGGAVVNRPYYLEVIDENRTYLRTTSGNHPVTDISVNRRNSGIGGDRGIDTFQHTNHRLLDGDQVFLTDGLVNALPQAQGGSPAITEKTVYDVYKHNADEVSLHRITDTSQTPKPALYDFDSTRNSIVLEESVNRNLTVVAGGGTQNPDTNASASGVQILLDDVISVASPYQNEAATTPDPGRFYLADNNSSSGEHVRRVDANGTVTTVAGGGSQSPDLNGTAINTTLSDIVDLAVDGTFRVYIGGGTASKDKVYRIETDDSIQLVAGGGTVAAVDFNSTQATQADFGEVISVAAEHQGTNFYVAEKNGSTYMVHRVDRASGVITRVIGGGAIDMDTNSSSALNCNITRIDDITVDSSGRVYFGDNQRGVVMRLDTGGGLTRVAGTSFAGTEATEGGLATTGRVPASTIAVTSSGDLILGGQTGVAGSVPMVRKVFGASGLITTMAGGGTLDPDGNGTIIASKVALANVTEVSVDSEGNVYIDDMNATESRVRKINMAVATPMPWQDGQVVYIVDTNASVPTSWPALPPYNGYTFPTGIQTGTGAPITYHGPFWVDVDGNTTLNPDGNEFFLSAGPPINNGSWNPRLGAGTGKDMVFDATQRISFTNFGQFQLVTGNTLDANHFFAAPSSCDLIKVDRVDFSSDNNSTIITLSDQVDFTLGLGLMQLSGTDIKVDDGDFDAEYSGVVGVRSGSAGALRMVLDTTLPKASTASYFGGAGTALARYSVMHDANGTFRFSTSYSTVPQDNRDTRADVICILCEGNGAGVAQYYSKTQRGTGAAKPDLIESANGIEDVKNPNHVNVVANRDRVLFLSCQWSAATPYYTFAHELGHVMGAHHGINDLDQVALNPLNYKTTGPSALQPNITFSPFRNDRITAPTDGGGLVKDSFIALGTYFTGAAATNTVAAGTGKYCTIMAYGGPRGNNSIYTRVGVFSSPHVYYQGTRTGEQYGWKLPPPLSRYDEPLIFDNSRALTTVGSVVAYYRDNNGTDRIGPEEVVVPEPPRGIVAGTPGVGQNTSVKRQSDGPITYAPGVVPQPGATPGSTIQMAAVGPKKKGGGGLSGAVNPQPVQPKPTPVQPKPSLPKGGVGIGAVTNPQPPKKPGGGLGGVTNPAPPPIKPTPGLPNDNFANPKRLPARLFAVLDNETNRGATGELGEQALPLYGRRSVWYRWDAPVGRSGRVTFSTKGSDFDTTLKVVPGGVKPTPGSVKVNDNALGGAWSEITLPYGGGSPKFYIIGIDGVDGAQGRIRISAQTR